VAPMRAKISPLTCVGVDAPVPEVMWSDARRRPMPPQQIRIPAIWAIL